MKRHKTSASSRLVYTALGFVAVGFLAAIIYITTEASSAGAKLANLGKEENRLTRENEQMADELVRLNSLIDLEEKASELGYVKPSKIMYVELSEVALNLP